MSRPFPLAQSVLVFIAMVASVVGESSEALPEQFTTTNAVSADPGSASPAELGVMFEAMEFYRAGDFIAAQRVLESAMQKFPDSYDVHYLYSATLVELSDYQKAIPVFEWMLDRNKQDYRVLNNYGWMLATASDAGIRDPKRALALAQESILYAPEHSSVWNTLAEAHYVNANFDRAVKAMVHALDLASLEPASADKIPQYQVHLSKMVRAADVMILLE